MWTLYLLPKNLFSWCFGIFAAKAWPKRIQSFINRRFADHYKLKMSEAELSSPELYPTLDTLFVRTLKPGLRPIESAWVHPADATLTTMAEIPADGVLIQAKGLTYTVEEIIGHKAAGMTGGFYSVYYLCPTDYHRVHCPVNAHIKQITYIPGQLWPVNSWSVQRISKLFARNERLVFELELNVGETLYLVMVGATNVGKMTSTLWPDLTTNRMNLKNRVRQSMSLEKQVVCGDELGVFHLGSTVVLLGNDKFVRSTVKAWPKDLPKATRMGQTVL